MIELSNQKKTIEKSIESFMDISNEVKEITLKINEITMSFDDIKNRGYIDK